MNALDWELLCLSIGVAMAVSLMLNALFFWLRHRSFANRFHCAPCKKTLRYPACCPHISEAGWAMIKNGKSWELPR